MPMSVFAFSSLSLGRVLFGEHWEHWAVGWGWVAQSFAGSVGGGHLSCTAYATLSVDRSPLKLHNYQLICTLSWVVSWSRSFLCTRHFWFTFCGRLTGFNITQVHNDMMQTIKHTVETLPSNNKQKVEASTPCPQGWSKGSNRTALQGRAGIA